MFMYENECDLLSIPVLSNISPSNTPHFFTHIILSLGCYKTEMDALCHPNFRACLRAVDLIGISEDEPSLKRYAEELLSKYIEEQLVEKRRRSHRTKTLFAKGESRSRLKNQKNY